ncbi:MAG: hypothetical protein IPM82_00565 [Saprospiraceae bacterium]|nr:hypothetical protein [Saprospiraceae bacterium]
MRTTIKLISAPFLIAILFLMWGCGNSDSANSKTHQEAVELTETMKLSHDGMMERLEFLKTENREFKKQVKMQAPSDSTLVSIVETQDGLISEFETMCRQQKKLIDENEDYLKKHERRAMDAMQMEEEHRRIRENYETLQLQAAAIVQEVENIKIRIDGAKLPQGAL